MLDCIQRNIKIENKESKEAKENVDTNVTEVNSSPNLAPRLSPFLLVSITFYNQEKSHWTNKVEPRKKNKPIK